MARSKNWRAVTPMGVELTLGNANSREEAFRIVQNRYGDRIAMEATYDEAPEGGRPLEEQICDFCGNKPVIWEYAARDWESTKSIGELGFPTKDRMAGAWSACTECKELYDLYGLPALILRAARVQGDRYAVQMAALVPKMRELLEKFELARVGDAIEIK